MYHIRVVNTVSGARAVQVIYYINRNRKIFKHIGSAKSDAKLNSLKIIAQDVIDNSVFQTSLYEDTKLDNLLFIDKSEFLRVYFSFLQEVFWELFSQVGIAKINNANQGLKYPIYTSLTAFGFTQPTLFILF
jgi:hypothetical protein